MSCYIARMRSSLLLSVLLLVACNKPADPVAPPSTAAAPKVETPPSAPAPSAPAASSGQLSQAAGAALSGPVQAGGLSWDAPAPFVRRPPKSSMRVAEYGLEGTPEAELSVFYFGADQGGGVEANITRWVGQFKQSDGRETEAKRDQRKVNSVEVALVEARGTYSGGMAMPGGPAPTALPDAMLLGAIAKGPAGSVFFKLVGPRSATESARPAFEGLIASLHSVDAAPKAP